MQPNALNIHFSCCLDGNQLGHKMFHFDDSKVYGDSPGYNSTFFLLPVERGSESVVTTTIVKKVPRSGTKGAKLALGYSLCCVFKVDENCFAPVLYIHFLIDVLKMILYSALTDHEQLSYFLVKHSLAY